MMGGMVSSFVLESRGGIPAVVNPAWNRFPVRHGFLTRQGGASPGLLASLNCNQAREDPEILRQNHSRVAGFFGSQGPVLRGFQEHGTRVQRVETPWDMDNRPVCDALVTSVPGVLIGVVTADCVPVLLTDPEAGVAGVAHAGWRGAAAGILEAVLEAMVEQGACMERIAVLTGPAIQPESYEVGEEVREAFAPEIRPLFFKPVPGADRPEHFMFDLPGVVMRLLEGFPLRHTACCRLDTFRAPDLFFSCRRAFKAGEPVFGNHFSGLMLTEETRVCPVF
jgi:YfiH family protein